LAYIKDGICTIPIARIIKQIVSVFDEGKELLAVYEKAPLHTILIDIWNSAVQGIYCI